MIYPEMTSYVALLDIFRADLYNGKDGYNWEAKLEYADMPMVKASVWLTSKERAMDAFGGDFLALATEARRKGEYPLVSQRMGWGAASFSIDLYDDENKDEGAED